MPYSGFTPKSTNTPRPAIAVNKKVTAAEWNALYQLVDENYTEFLAVGLAVITRFDTAITISSAGVYIFFGSVARTVTISDGIVGEVQIRTVATADLTLSALLAAGHLGVISEGQSVTSLIWDSTLGKYTY